MILIPVQINGRFTCQIEVPDDADELVVEQAAREATKDKVLSPLKVIVVSIKGAIKIVNVVDPQAFKPRPCE